jgi:hypothetical protein
LEIKWSEIEAECGDYRAGFVSVFRKYEGQETDEKDRYDRPVKVTIASFARHMGIKEGTFRDWVNPPERRGGGLVRGIRGDLPEPELERKDPLIILKETIAGLNGYAGCNLLRMGEVEKKIAINDLRQIIDKAKNELDRTLDSIKITVPDTLEGI